MRLSSLLRNPASAVTHFLGALLSAVGLGFLIQRAVAAGTVWHLVSFPIFGTGLLLLYTASTLYHSLRLPPESVKALRRIDHIMVFVLIASTYTPFCLVPLRGPWGWSLFGTAWGLAAAGAVLKLVWLEAPRWLSTGFYVAMGWLVIIAVYPLAKTVTPAGLAWLAAGGFLYTTGAVCYATKWPDPWPGRFGFHEIWHLFVIGGSLSHFAAVLSLA
ncbi:MAG: hemolysin III family protein [Bacillota bacterium]|nr:MAG: hemolysin III family protein [Bacillota bacterium]